MEGLLRNSLEQIIEESRMRLVETIGRTEEIWQPYNLQTTTKLRDTLLDMDAMGIDMKSQVTGDTWINLTPSTVNFCRHFLSVTESCGYLAKNETLKMNVEILLKDLFLAQHSIKPSPAITVDVSFCGVSWASNLLTIWPLLFVSWTLWHVTKAICLMFCYRLQWPSSRITRTQSVSFSVIFCKCYRIRINRQSQSHAVSTRRTWSRWKWQGMHLG